MTNKELIRRYTESKDNEAFRAIVERNASLVLGVTMRILKNPSEAEDACQATFIYLAQNAQKITHPQHLSTWLYRVAMRMALQAKTMNEKKLKRETLYAEENKLSNEGNSKAWQEIKNHLDEAVNCLPGKLQDAVIACYFEGQTYDEAAVSLSTSSATIRGRLERARKLLRKSFNRKGITISSASLATLVAQNASAQVHPKLINTLSHNGLLSINSTLPQMLSSSPAYTLALETTKIMLMKKLTLTLTSGLLLVSAIVLTLVFRDFEQEASHASPEEPIVVFQKETNQHLNKKERIISEHLLIASEPPARRFSTKDELDRAIEKIDRSHDTALKFKNLHEAGILLSHEAFLDLLKRKPNGPFNQYLEYQMVLFAAEWMKENEQEFLRWFVELPFYNNYHDWLVSLMLDSLLPERINDVKTIASAIQSHEAKRHFLFKSTLRENPKASLSLALEAEGQAANDYINDALRTLSQNDLGFAMDWISRNLSDSNRDQAYHNVLVSLISKKPEELDFTLLNELINRFSNETFKTKAQRSLDAFEKRSDEQAYLEELRKLHPLEAIERLEVDDKSPQKGLRAIIRNWAKHDIQAAKNYVINSFIESPDNEPHNHITLQELTSIMLETDIDNALLWAKELPDELSSKALNTVYYAKGSRDGFVSVIDDILALNEKRKHDSIIADRALDWSAENPQGTIEWLMQRQEAEALAKHIDSVYLEWAKVEPRAAFAFAQNNNLEIQPTGIAAAAEAIAITESLETAGQWVESMPPTKKRNPATLKIASQHFRLSPEKGLRFLHANHIGKVNEDTTIKLVIAGAYYQPSDAATMLENLNTKNLPAKTLTEAYSEIAYGFAMKKSYPKALDWLSGLKEQSLSIDLTQKFLKKWSRDYTNQAATWIEKSGFSIDTKNQLLGSIKH